MKHFVIFLLIITGIQLNACSEKENDEQVPPKPTTSVNRFVVVTYNIHGGIPVNQSNIDLSGIAGVLYSQKADIVLLQEVDSCTSRSGLQNQAKVIAEKTGLKYYYFFKAINYQNGGFGNAIISKYPLDSCKLHLLPWISGQEQRVLGTAIVKVNDTTRIRVGSTHLDLNASNRIKETAEIQKILSNQKLPALFGGDFNASPTSPEMQTLINNFSSSTNNYLLTFPANKPSQTIDFVFTSKEGRLKVITHNVYSSTASDHLPVVVKMEYK